MRRLTRKKKKKQFPHTHTVNREDFNRNWVSQGHRSEITRVNTWPTGSHCNRTISQILALWKIFIVWVRVWLAGHGQTIGRCCHFDQKFITVIGFLIKIYSNWKKSFHFASHWLVWFKTTTVDAIVCVCVCVSSVVKSQTYSHLTNFMFQIVPHSVKWTLFSLSCRWWHSSITLLHRNVVAWSTSFPLAWMCWTFWSGPRLSTFFSKLGFDSHCAVSCFVLCFHSRSSARV